MKNNYGDNVIVDASLVQTLRSIADLRMTEREGAVNRQPEWEKFLVGDGRRFIQILRHRAESASRKQPPPHYATPTGLSPAYILTYMSPGDPTHFVRIYTNGDMIEAPQGLPKNLIEHLSGWAICPPVAVPYGYVDDNNVVRLIYFLTTEKLAQRSDTSKDHDYIGAFCFVRRGCVIPEPLVDGVNSSYIEWLSRFWSLVDVGRVVAITSLLKNARSVSFFGEGGVCPYLRVEGSIALDGQPQIADGEPHSLWHPAEAYPGQLYTSLWGSKFSTKEVETNVQTLFE